MNMSRLLDVLEQLGVDNPIVNANINKIGLRMCSGDELYEKTIATRRFRPIAMIVFGAPSRANIRHTKMLIDELDGRREKPRRPTLAVA